MTTTEARVALVTGASRGIGQAIARSLGKTGLTVVGTATSASGAQAITEDLTAHGIKGCGLVMNVTDAAAIEHTLAAVRSDFGPATVVVNNAGITDDTLLLRMKSEQWQRVIETNLTGVFEVTRLSLKAMVKARFGRIINIGSVVGAMGNLGQANYAAAKAGLIGFTKSVAREVASRGVTANVVAPGFIQTDMTDKLPESQREGLLKQIPAGRLGQPDDIAQAVCFLASDHAGYITGETLHVNGGMLMD